MTKLQGRDSRKDEEHYGYTKEEYLLARKLQTRRGGGRYIGIVDCLADVKGQGKQKRLGMFWEWR